MVMADVTVISEMMAEEEKRIKSFLEQLGQKLKDKKVGGTRGNGANLKNTPFLMSILIDLYVGRVEV